MNQPAGDVTAALGRIEAGDDAAKTALFEMVYDELRALAGGLMNRERTEHTLQPTALVNEASIRILKSDDLASLRGRKYFFGAMANAMRRVLVDHARKRNRLKRGGSETKRVPLDTTVELFAQQNGFDLVKLDDALRDLAEVGPREAQIVELRFFGGYQIRDIAEQLGISDATVKRDLQFARLWLKKHLADHPSDE